MCTSLKVVGTSAHHVKRDFNHFFSRFSKHIILRIDARFNILSYIGLSFSRSQRVLSGRYVNQLLCYFCLPEKRLATPS